MAKAKTGSGARPAGKATNGEELVALLEAARRLCAALVGGEAKGGEAERGARAVARLEASVLRPLRDAVAKQTDHPKKAAPDRPGPGAPETTKTPFGQTDEENGLAQLVWGLAERATRMRLRPGMPAELQEATATLQDLACELAPEDDSVCGAAAKLAELAKLQAALPRCIQVAHDGPYLVTNADRLVDWLGRAIPTRPQMALCRCGGSEMKPFCDGTHARIGFSEGKDPKRVSDRRDTYPGQQVTIFDNRGTCQHSGYCSDRLATVFRAGQDPFVAPSGGRMDEIIRAVRDCPSGALSYAIDGVEARTQVDWETHRPPAIEVSKDGPYRISGGIPLTDGDGQHEPCGEGASREHYALCRCGHSQNKPFCSGMHWYVAFRDPVPALDQRPTLFEWCGGLPGLTRMTRHFYEKHVPADPLLAPLFANMSPDHPQRVAKWLAEVFGGPACYSDDYGGYPRMLSQHLGKQLTEDMRARWVALICQSAQEAGLPADPEFRSAFTSYVEWRSRLALENSQLDAHPPQTMPMPHWDWGTAGPPGIRVSALTPEAEEERQQVKLPAANEQVSFAAHIKPLFRGRDRQSMKFAFDLWSYDQVKANGHAIFEHLKNGSMPCDGAWPPAQVSAFERWLDSGMPE